MRPESDKIFVSDETTRKYRSLLRLGKAVFTPADIKDIRKAFLMIQQAGADRRVFGEDAINFGLDVALITSGEIGLRKISVISSMLFHFVLDGSIRIEDVQNAFGAKVATMTRELSAISAISVKDTRQQAENFRTMLLTIVTDVQVILIKLAERMKLMRILDHFPEPERYSFASDTFYLFAPLAHRLGLYNIKTEMEDLSLRQINPEAYSSISRKLAETSQSRNRFIREFVQPIKDALSRQGLDFEIKARLKSVYSIYNKMVKQGVEFEEVYDIFAIRIILNSQLSNEKSDCWHVYSTVTDFYQPNPSRMRDWISVPKSNGYESLHATVIGPSGKWVEVQIRTARMDEIAEKGLAAHWKYKGGQVESGMEQWLGQIREALETPDSDSSEVLDSLKLDLNAKEVFVFTPQGDIRKLPTGSTILDFAFDIHTGLGATCMGGRVNGKNVPLRYVLQSGDKVEIQTSKNQKPNGGWLAWVVTSKAKSRIKALLKEEERKVSEQGREILQRKLKNWKINFDDHVLAKIQKHLKLKSFSEVFLLVATDKLDVSEIKEWLTEKDDKQKLPEKIDELAVVKLAKPRDLQPGDLIVIDEVGGWQYKLAKCCNPIYGDRIFGFVTINEGVKIHRENCPNATQLLEKFGYRVLPARWSDSDDVSMFQADIMITGNDDIGIVSRISDVISREMKIPMRSINVKTNDGLFEAAITVFVPDLTKLEGLLHQLRRVKGVKNVSRGSSG